ncbi:MarR family winged helix-turn-helix transcriptional regulator [Arthrobacter woluwensis]|uniref:MarR family winged helix-turn-helix transcriptional regulator n=1 Tax=Arthrobacter woluwensis TaxID=156980 RepID=UPI0011A54381|nr:MarR family winged helix-turn-helix transcriptional regulator [Arthrobacter woluwensis]
MALDRINRSWLDRDRENHALTALHLVREFCIADYDARESLRSELNINSIDLDALCFIVNAPDTAKVTLRVLGEHLDITSASTSALVGRLLAASYLATEVDAHDLRARNLKANPAARTMVEARLRRHFDALVGAAGSFEPDELGIVTRYLEAIINALRYP